MKQTTLKQPMEDSKVGKRIRLIEMIGDPEPIENGAEGTVTNVISGILFVNWDGGRTLGVIDGFDKYQILN